MAALTIASPCFAESSGGQLAYVIPINGEIERGLVYVIRRGVSEAVSRKADAIILEMNTPGGRIDSTEEIVKILDGINVPVVTYVNPRAISAGAIISLATDKIYMKPGSTIGDAMPILLNQQDMPADRKEKMVSYVAAKVRGIAEKKGHNVDLAECMVRIEKEFKIGDEVICPAGELLTLTSFEAEKKYGSDNKSLLSSGSMETLDDLLKELGLESATVKTLEVSYAEKIARWIDMTAVSGLILALGLLALYMEFKTPGFGVFGISGLILLSVWFWGHNVAGLAGFEEIALFIVGVVLLAIEIFVIPGFGITGISGIVLIVTALVLAMVQHYPGGNWYPPVTHLEGAATSLGLALTICAIGVIILARFLPETAIFKRIMLTSAVAKEQGYQAGASLDALAGEKGVAETDLHPGGIATIAGKRYTVVSRGDFIDSGTRIIIVQTKGNRIVVDRLAEEAKS